jgi:hypothetical protein
MRRSWIAAIVLALPLLAATPGVAPAQARPLDGKGAVRPRAARAGAAQPRRQQLEQQVRRRMWRIAKQRVGFTDDQMTKLTATSQRFDARRRAFNQEERAQRLLLRREILAGAKGDQTKVAGALDRLQQLQRQRADLQAEEQKEYGTFMTPIQRARYAALQEEMRRRVETLRRQRPDSGGG